MSRESVRPVARSVGTIVAVTPTGTVTVRSSGPEFPAEGTVVADRRGVVRGEVVRIFGPVARPYLRVRPRRPPTPAEGAQLLGAEMVGG